MSAEKRYGIGPVPERDQVFLSGQEDDTWEKMCEEYGDWALPESEMRQHFVVSADVPGTVLDGPMAVAHTPEAGVDVQRTLDAHHAWMDLGDELGRIIPETRVLAIRMAKVSAAIGGIVGMAVGFGISELVRVFV